MPEAAQSLQQLLASAGAVFAAAGVADARGAAHRLWSDLERRPRADALLARCDAVDAERATRYLAAVARRVAGEPLAYVTGWTGFRHLVLACDRRALIPRPETEGLVEAALLRVRGGVAADVGTGTGAIALALRQEGAFDEVLAIDRSPEALALARENGAATGLAVTWLEGDLLAPLAGRMVDLLVSNPPYLTEAEYAALEPGVRDFEPRLALPSGEDGLEATRRLLDEGRAVMRPGGWLAMEVDARRAAESAAIAERSGWQAVTVLDDLFGRARYLLARHGSGA